MKNSVQIIPAALIAAMLVACANAQAQTPELIATDVVTYIEVTPAGAAEAGNLLRQLAAASRKESGNFAYVVLQQIERPSQFAILETWKDARALEAHDAGSAMKQFRQRLDPLRVGYYDQRIDTPIDAPLVTATPEKDWVYVVTHIDVTGQFKDEAIAMMKKLAADSRLQAGCQRFEVWDQNNRLNHFTMVEIWKDRGALDAHNAAASTREFRDKLGHMMGALYDDRRYRSLE
jgi:quinol monooxygenase YgiN